MTKEPTLKPIPPITSFQVEASKHFSSFQILLPLHTVTSLYSNLAGLKVASGNVQSGASVTINSARIALVLVGRAAASVHVTTAFIDQWGGIVYIDNNTDFVVSKSSGDVTITNNASSVANYLVLYTS